MILCDLCRKVEVDTDGMLCEVCETIPQSDLAEDRQGVSHDVYLPTDLFQKYKKIVEGVEAGDRKAETLMGKFMSALKTAFIDQKTGKVIANPKPNCITPREGNLAKIQRIIEHNAKVNAQMIIEETKMDDWTVDDIRSDEFEQTIFQEIGNTPIAEMKPDTEMEAKAEQQSSSEIQRDPVVNDKETEEKPEVFETQSNP